MFSNSHTDATLGILLPEPDIVVSIAEMKGPLWEILLVDIIEASAA